MLNVREAKNADINQILFHRLVAGQEASEALHSDDGLSDDVSHDFDVNSGALDNVVVVDQFAKPLLNL